MHTLKFDRFIHFIQFYIRYCFNKSNTNLRLFKLFSVFGQLLLNLTI